MTSDGRGTRDGEMTRPGENKECQYSTVCGLAHLCEKDLAQPASSGPKRMPFCCFSRAHLFDVGGGARCTESLRFTAGEKHNGFVLLQNDHPFVVIKTAPI